LFSIFIFLFFFIFIFFFARKPFLYLFLISHFPFLATAPTSSRARTTKPVVSSWDSQPKSNQEASAGSWASIASSKQAHDDTTTDNGWNTNSSNDNTGTSTTDDWAPIPAANNGDDADQPKTWASLLK
jgi:hypothetical protein